LIEGAGNYNHAWQILMDTEEFTAKKILFVATTFSIVAVPEETLVTGASKLLAES